MALLTDLPTQRAALQREADNLLPPGTAQRDIQATESALATAFVTRALVLLITLNLNSRNQLMADSSSMARDLQQVMRVLHRMGGSGRDLPWLPRRLHVMIAKMALGNWGESLLFLLE